MKRLKLVEIPVDLANELITHPYSQGFIVGKENTDNITLMKSVFAPLKDVKGSLYDVVRIAPYYLKMLGEFGLQNPVIVPFFKDKNPDDYLSLPREIAVASSDTINYCLFIDKGVPSVVATHTSYLNENIQLLGELISSVLKTSPRVPSERKSIDQILADVENHLYLV